MFFQVNITPKARQVSRISHDEPDIPSILVLGPFQPQTRLNFQANINTKVTTDLTIRNPTDRALNVRVTKRPPIERDIILNYSDLIIDPNSDFTVTLSWTPKEIGSWRDTLQFTDSRRIKYDVALTSTCSGVKKGCNKGPTRSRVLTQPNEIRDVNKESKKVLETSTKIINERNLTLNSKCRENKENTHIIRKTLPKRSHIDDINTNVMKNLDMSHFQLTPINSSYCTKSVKVPHINILDATPSKSETQILNATDVDFIPNDASIISPNNIENKPPLRRETYLNPEPKFCKSMASIDETEDEYFNDSLSPPPITARNELTMNFSMVLNDIVNYTTPMKSISPAACSTGRSDKESRLLSDAELSSPAAANNTFDIITADTVEQSSLYNNCNVNQSPTSTHTVGRIRPSRLTSTFAKISPDSPTSNVPKIHLISSSPSSITDYRRVDVVSSKLKSSDTTTVKAVLEADLWANNDHINQATSSTSCQESFNDTLEIISDEAIIVTKKINVSTIKNTEKYVAIMEKSKGLCVEISPPMRIANNSRRIVTTKKISPLRHNRVTKDKVTGQHNQILRKIVQDSNTSSKQRNTMKIPNVKIAKLCLTNLNATSVPNKSTATCSKTTISTANSPKNKSKYNDNIKMPDPNKVISSIRNRDPFAASMTEDPFLTHSLYYDDQWIYHQELEFTKWLNALLTPPEHNADVETAPIDVGKVWQSCRAKENIALAETKEAVSARYHNTNQRLNTLRKAACSMFARDEVKNILAQVVGCIEKGIFVIRQDRDLHRDIGLQKAILELLLSYNPLWLRIGLEVVYGETIPLNSNNDLIGLTRFLISRFFSDPYLVQTYSHPNVISFKLPAFQSHMNKFLLKKFLLIVYFLDYAKRHKLIGHDPCLFHKKATNKDSRAILLTFSREVLSGVGDLTKILRAYGYVVSHKQTYIDEYNYAVKDISSDLRDGVRLCRVMELIIGDRTLTSQCRVPSISRLQKIFNADLALKSLIKAGYQITGDIDAKSIVDGHREKTLSLLWQIIYKFQRPRFENAAISLQKWWRAMLWYVRVKNYLSQRRNNAACVIQCAWRCYKAKKLTQLLRETREHHLKIRDESVRIIQLRWINRRMMLHDRRNFIQIKIATVRIQKWFRRIRTSRPYLQDLQKKRQAAIILQCQLRATIAMRRERMAFKNLKQATMIIQQRWRATSLKSSAQNYYQKLREAIIFIQLKWRAQRQMKIEYNSYIKKREAIIKIQKWWRNIIIVKRHRNNYILQRNAASVIKSWWRNLKFTRECQQKYLIYKRVVVLIQIRWRAKILAKSIRQKYIKLQQATITIQKYWRMISARRIYLHKLIRHKAAIVLQRKWRAKKIGSEIHENYMKRKAAAILIQRKYRANRRSFIARKQYLMIKRSIIIIQKNWRMLNASRDFKRQKNAALIIQRQWRARKLSIAACQSFTILKNAVIIIQRHYRSLRIGKIIRKKYLTTRQATLTIQRAYRSNKLMQQTRMQYLQYCNAIVRAQSIWRMIRIRREYHSKIYATLIIQRTWRRIIIARYTRREFLTLKYAIIFVQRHYRLKKMSIKIQQDYNKLRNTVIWIQRTWRIKQIMRERSIEFIEKQKLNNAATIIQAFWRGYKIRTLQSAQIRELRERAKQAAAAVTPLTTVEYRLQAAMDVLQNFTNLGQLSMCLACIDTLTRLSPKGCVLFCELKLVDRLYIILEKANRSLPWMDVCKRCTNILITLVKLPQTSSYVFNIEETETVVRLMNTAIKYDIDLFLHLATFFWLLSNNSEFEFEIKNSQRTIWLLRTLITSAIKKEATISMKTKCKHNSSTKQPILLPNLKPDWGLNTRSPRCFTTIEHVISILSEIYNIIPIS